MAEALALLWLKWQGCSLNHPIRYNLPPWTLKP
jgi:hypothetical protein